MSPSIGHYGGDYTFAGMFLARAALDSSVICENLNASSEQNGKCVLDILKSFGARVKRAGDNVNVSCDKLRGCTVDITEFTKISPVIALLALFATGKTRIHGFGDDTELQNLIIENLRILGARCEYNSTDLWIWPQRSVEHGVLNARNNPYMSLALVLTASYIDGETVIRNVDGLLTRYAEFEEIFTSLGGQMKIVDKCIL